jgi:peptidoglycan/xylan/chitin deacetylase (PgdA/CDA1 family)
MTLEHLAGDPASRSTLASLTLPLQPEDGPLGVSLKADLIEDDLLVEAAAALRSGEAAQAAEQASQWVKEVLSPYLAQLPAPAVAPRVAARAFCRSRLYLSLESALLVSPFVMGRNWLRRWRRRCPVLILAYHLVSDRGHRMGISTERFWRQVRFLQRHYRIVSLKEAARLLDSGENAAPAVSLTFDDGYADNFVSLRAVADEAGIPVSIFLTTRPVSLHTEFQHDVAKGERGAFPLSWDQVRYWSRRGAEFGGHTRTHVNCGTNQATVLQEELHGAREDLERELGAPATFFAFPYGQRESISKEARRVAQSTYAHFLSSFGGENIPNGARSHAHLLRKPAYTEPWELELDLQSVFDLVGAAKRWFRARAGSASSPARPSLVPASASLQGGLAAPGPGLNASYEVPIRESAGTPE